MPPAISDDERSSPLSGDDDVLPPKKPATKKSAAKSKPKPAIDEDPDEHMADVKNGDAEVQDDDDDEDDKSDEYVVEKILSHAPGQAKTTLYEVKWMGYENPTDRTWEPEENLEGAMDILQAYWDSIGGKPQPKTPAKKGTKRKSTAAAAEQDTPEVSTSSTRRRARKAPKTEEEEAGKKTTTLPEGSWEDHVQGVDSIEMPEEGEHKGNLMIYLLWENGTRTQHTTLQCRSKCPNKLIDYYESKLFVNLSKPKTRRRRSTNKA